MKENQQKLVITANPCADYFKTNSFILMLSNNVSICINTTPPTFQTAVVCKRKYRLTNNALRFPLSCLLT